MAESEIQDLSKDELKQLRNKFNAWNRRKKAKREALIAENPNITNEELLANDTFIRNEELVQCIDRDIVDRKLYIPCVAVSNMGRIWSIPSSKWLVPIAAGTKERNYWQVNPNYKYHKYFALVHRLVKYYFLDESDKACIKKCGYGNIEVHHKEEIIIPDELKQRGRQEDKILHCMSYNNAKNLQVIEKKDHNNITDILNGNDTEYIDADSFTRFVINNMGHSKDPKNKAEILYTDTKDSKTINLTWRLKGSDKPASESEIMHMINDVQKQNRSKFESLKITSDDYRKMASEGKISQAEADKKCRVLDFLGTCDHDDRFIIFDTEVFDKYIKDCVSAALGQTVTKEIINQEQACAIGKEFVEVFEEQRQSRG